MHQSFRDIAQREANARAHLVETIATLGKVSKDDAEKVAAYYLKYKLAKLDVRIGQSRVIHGAYLDARTIACAIATVNMTGGAK